MHFFKVKFSTSDILGLGFKHSCERNEKLTKLISDNSNLLGSTTKTKKYCIKSNLTQGFIRYICVGNGG